MSKAGDSKSKKIIEGEANNSQCRFFYGDTELGVKVNDVLNSGAYALFTTGILIYTLFSDDTREIFFPSEADVSFSITTLTCMIFYTFEIIVMSLFQKDYFLKYYFWLDIMSTITMVFDLIWITQYITGGGKSAANISQISKASRAARLGTRTVRLIRLVRMIKILKQMKLLAKDLAKNQTETQPKKISQRISSIHSKLSSLRNVERLSSLRHMEKIPSKRWSLIKDINCVGVGQLPSINCLPFKEQDEIIDRQSAKGRSSKCSSQAKQANSGKNIPSIHKIQLGVVEASHLEEIIEQGKEEENDQKFNTKLSKPIRSKKINKTQNNIQNSQNDIAVPPESKVGSRVQNEIQKNVILMIILILISIPLLDASTWYNSNTVYDKGIDNLLYFATNDAKNYQMQANQYITDALTFLNPLLYFNINVNTFNDVFPDNYNSYSKSMNEILQSTRASDIDIYETDFYTVAFDISTYNKLVAIFNISRTFFVCALLIFTTMLFSNDLEFAAIAPLEEMFDTVRKIAVHPLNALREIEEKNMCLQKLDEDKFVENTEPRVLQNTIVKIGSLLAVGFGEAGTEIICRVIEDPSIINVMIPGQKIMAIFGFCDIRNFTDATEVLEADVMVFVNEIAAICHKTVYQHLGSPNKNIGDAFLLVWKYAQQDCKITQTADEMKIELLHTPKVRQQAELAVLSIIKMIAEITKAENLQKYKNNKGLQERIPNYGGVKLGYGLHVGWAIEGPIGSEYKIDASYLSPHVHMSSRLEAATKAYGSLMLITGEVYNLMTKNRSNLRQVDRVIPVGQTEAMNLYTVDIQPKHLFEQIGIKNLKKLNEKEKKAEKVYQNINRKKLWQDIEKQGATDALWNDQDIKIMQEPYSKQFYQVWERAFQSYIKGNWKQSLPLLNEVRMLAPDGVDGPSESLINFIEQNNGVAPENWAGWRQFD